MGLFHLLGKSYTMSKKLLFGHVGLKQRPLYKVGV